MLNEIQAKVKVPNRSSTMISCSDCGIDMWIRNDYVERHSGKCMSCGKAGNNNASKHGKSKSRLYRIWAGLSQRRYKYPVVVCSEWLDYPTFMEWAMANGYEDSLTIDRVDPRKGYEPDNCQWITREENSGKDKIIWNAEEKISAYLERKALGITQRAYAEFSGVSRRTVLRAEKYAKGVCCVV